MRALGYASAAGVPEIDAQRAGIEAACRQLGLELVTLVTDRGANGDRPGLWDALERIDDGEAACLIVSDLDRLGARVAELAAVLDRIDNSKARLIALDVGLDTATPSGRLAIEPVGPAAEREDESVEEAEREPVADVVSEPVDEPVSEVVSESVDELEPASESLSEAVPEPVLEAVPEPVLEAVPEPVLEAVPEPDFEAVPEPVLEAAPEPVVDAVPQPVSEPALDVVSQPILEPALEPIAEPEPAGPDVPARGARAPQRELVLALGYASVPADGNVSEDLDEQKLLIEREAERLGFKLVEVVREREPKAGRALDRAGLSYLIGRIAAGDASCVVVSALDKLSRSVAELGMIVQWLERNEVRLVATDIALDTASPGGRTTALALASVAKWEHERVSQRTRSGLAAARAKRRAAAGPDWADVRERIARMRADGMTLQGIADVLNAEGVPTPRGGAQWRPSSVQTAAGYKRRTRAKQLDDLPTIGKQARKRSPETPGSGAA